MKKNAIENRNIGIGNFCKNWYPPNWSPGAIIRDVKVLEYRSISYMSFRFILLALFTLIFSTWITLIAAYGQENGENADDTVVLLPPDYVCAQYGFGVALPDGYYVYDLEDENIWMAVFESGPDDANARIAIEELPDDVTDVAGYWQYLKDRDALMERNITYEKIDTIAGTGAIQARVERIERGGYILAITWVFVHDGYGFTLTGYPPESGDYNSGRDLSLAIAEQFRWMTDEEIEDFEDSGSDEVDFEIPEGREF